MSLRLYATALAIAGGLFATQGVGATEVANGLTMNGLTMNGLTMNGLTMNGLTMNGLTMNGLATNGTASDAATVTAVILPDGSRVTLN